MKSTSLSLALIAVLVVGIAMPSSANALTYTCSVKSDNKTIPSELSFVTATGERKTRITDTHMKITNEKSRFGDVDRNTDKVFRAKWTMPLSHEFTTSVNAVFAWYSQDWRYSATIQKKSGAIVVNVAGTGVAGGSQLETARGTGKCHVSK